VNDFECMQLALVEARSAAANGEVPVGAIFVLGDGSIAAGANRTIADCDPTAHAAGNHRLTGATLYVTLEPCAMCAGALVQARIARLVYGADDPRGGAVRTCLRVLDEPALNHRIEVTTGILADESAALLQAFFAARR